MLGRSGHLQFNMTAETLHLFRFTDASDNT